MSKKFLFLYIFVEYYSVLPRECEYDLEKSSLFKYINKDKTPLCIKNDIVIYENNNKTHLNNNLFSFLIKENVNDNNNLTFIYIQKPSEIISGSENFDNIIEKNLLNKTFMICNKYNKKATNSIILMSNGNDMCCYEYKSYMLKSKNKKPFIKNENIKYELKEKKIILQRDIKNFLYIFQKYKVGMKINKQDKLFLEEAGVCVFENNNFTKYYLVSYYKPHKYGECANKNPIEDKEFIVFLIVVDTMNKITYLSLKKNCCEEINV